MSDHILWSARYWLNRIDKKISKNHTAIINCAFWYTCWCHCTELDAILFLPILQYLSNGKMCYNREGRVRTPPHNNASNLRPCPSHHASFPGIATWFIYMEKTRSVWIEFSYNVGSNGLWIRNTTHLNNYTEPLTVCCNVWISRIYPSFVFSREVCHLCLEFQHLFYCTCCRA